MRLLFLLCTVATLNALEELPWLPTPYQPQIDLSYDYSEFPKVNQSKEPLHHTSHDQLAALDAGIATPTFGADLDCEFAHTPRFPWGFRSSAGQVRMQWMNDLTGDNFTFTTGLSVRVVSAKALTDISTPYHAAFNGEVTLVLGQERPYDETTRSNCYLLGALGVANQGSPWARAVFDMAFTQSEKTQLDFYAEGYWGFGSKTEVHIHHFDGWGPYRHQSIDVGLAFRYFCRADSPLSFAYTRRLYAKSYPADLNSFLIRYQFPLSL